jgi:nucleoid DNA-binding protein
MAKRARTPKKTLRQLIEERYPKPLCDTYNLAVDIVVRIILHEVVEGRGVIIRNLGSFLAVTHGSRWARNPKTMEDVLIPEGTKIRFRPAAPLKSAAKDAALKVMPKS